MLKERMGPVAPAIRMLWKTAEKHGGVASH